MVTIVNINSSLNILLKHWVFHFSIVSSLSLLSLFAFFMTCLVIRLWISPHKLKTSWIVTPADMNHNQVVMEFSVVVCSNWLFTISMWLSPLWFTWAFDSSEPILRGVSLTCTGLDYSQLFSLDFFRRLLVRINSRSPFHSPSVDYVLHIDMLLILVYS